MAGGALALAQNPGIGGLEELTSAEELFIQNLVGLSYAQGDILYHDGTSLTRLGAGTNGHFLKTQGAGANPTWAATTTTPSGSDTQVQFNDAGSMAGDAGMTYNKTTDTLTLATGIVIGSSNPFSDSAGTLTLQNVDALDATTESTIEAAIDTLANLTSIQGQTVTLTGAFIRSGAHSLTLTTTGVTSVTLPTSGTLATLDGSEVFTNKTLTSPTITTSPTAAGATWTDLGTVTTADINGGTVDGVTIGGASAGAITGTTVTVNTNLLPDANDGAGLGISGTAFSDLFLASGGVINWLAGDATITHSAGLLTSNVDIVVPAEVYGAGWNGSNEVPTKNDVYDKIEAVVAGAGANTALSNLASVAINTTLVSDTDNTDALGTSAIAWSDLFLGSGAVITFNSAPSTADVTLTHSADTLTLGGGNLALGANSLTLTGSIAATGARVTKGWFTDIESTNMPTVGGTAILTSLTAPQFTTIELGHATQNTLSASGGVLSVEGVNVLTVAGGTLTGSINLGENAGLTYDAALSADGKYSGFVRAGTAGATLAFGDLVYLAAADSRWELADADAASTSGDVLLGMCVLAAANDGDATTILLQGFIRADAAFPALTISAPAYVSTTAGDIQTAQPSGTDDVIRRVGFAWTADELYFNPSNDYVTHT